MALSCGEQTRGTVKLVRDAANLPSLGTHPSHYRGDRFPPDILSSAVWLYQRFCLSSPGERCQEHNQLLPVHDEIMFAQR